MVTVTVTGNDLIYVYRVHGTACGEREKSKGYNGISYNWQGILGGLGGT